MASTVADQQSLEMIAATDASVGRYLQEYCTSKLSILKTFSHIVGQTLPDAGVRLRPILLRVGYEAGGRSFENILPIAAGIELMQISTLVIDDVLDKSSIRNAKPTVYAEWGMEQAVATGTAMSSMGLNLVANALHETKGLNNSVLILGMLLQVQVDIYVGQFMDMAFEGDAKILEEQYLEMISKTTGSFIQASLVVGGMLWDAPQDVISAFRDIGIALGMAYQLRDDAIDVIGEAEYTGKPVAGDIRQRRMRLPVIHALARSNGSKADPVLGAFMGSRALEDLQVESIVDSLIRSGSVYYTFMKAKDYCKRAVDSINTLPSEYGNTADQLRTIAHLIGSFEEEDT